MNRVRIRPSHAVIVFIIGAMCAAVIVGTDSAPSEIQDTVSSVARNQRLQVLTTQLAEKHGYKLNEVEPFKYIPNCESETRDLLHYVLRSNENWSAPPKKFAFDPFTLVFEADTQGRLVQATAQEGITTLVDVFENTLGLLPQYYNCPDGLLTTYVPGDWILLRKLDPKEGLSQIQLATLEKILNEQMNMRVRVNWEMTERPALVIRGAYKANPKQPKIKFQDETAVLQSDGMFVVPARRETSNHPAIMRDDFSTFTQVIGSLLMLPVVIETDSRPDKSLITWNEAGKSIAGNDRLQPELEARVLKSLAEQTGFEFQIETREVKLLTIEPIGE